MQRLAVAGLAALVAGCVTAPPREYPDLKEVYVDAAAVTSAPALRQVPFPLPPEAEAGVYSALRGLRTGAVEGMQKLARALGQWPPPGADPHDPQVIAAAPELDVSAYPAHDPPVILVATGSHTGGREETASYLGHCAYAGGGLDAGGREVVHHLRLLVVNREAQPVCLDVLDVELEAEGLAVLERLTAADADGARLESLEVLPGEQGLAHVFFAGTQVPPSIVARWRLRGAREGELVGSFQVQLQRRYIINPGRVSALEDAAARRLPLPEPRPRPGDPWREPRMEPVGR